jgi:hypothetical protein
VSQSSLKEFLADQQGAARGFYKMKFARFDASEDGAGGCPCKHRSFIRRKHLHLCRARTAPEGAASRQANGGALAFLNRDFGFGFRSSHLVKSACRKRLFGANRLATVGFSTLCIVADEQSENL